MSDVIDLRWFAESLMIFRKSKGLSMREAVLDLDGISVSTLSRIENGGVPELDNYFKLCRWMDRNPLEFLTRSFSGVQDTIRISDVLRFFANEESLEKEIRDVIITVIMMSYKYNKK